MADNKKTRYDKKNKAMWIYREYEKPKTLVPNDELKGWVERRKDGETEDGRPLEQVNYVFSNDQTAKYNHQPLTFSKFGVYVGNLDDYDKYESGEGDPGFETRKDFGIE